MRRKPETLLKNWSRHGDRLYGQFYHHTVIGDGAFAHTSRVVHLDERGGFAETENTVYSLGQHQQNACGRRWCSDSGTHP